MLTRNCALMLIGLTALLLGTLVYLTDRPPGETALPDNLNLYGLVPTLFGAVGRHLPAFAHVFGFSLLTVALIDGGRHAAIAVCVGWFLVNSAFELGQHAVIAPSLSQVIPAWFENIPILARARGYFLYGTFDSLDVLAIGLGALAAYLVLQRIPLRRANHES